MTTPSGSPLASGAPRIGAVIPVGVLEGAKSRLGGHIDAEERRTLVEGLLARTVETALRVARLADVLVVSPDPEALDRAAAAGARTLRQRSVGLGRGLRDGLEDVVAGGAEAVLILPIDLPLVSVEAIDALLDTLVETSGRTVILVTDRQGVGTNALVLRPPDVIDLAFGGASRAAHRAAAEAAGARYVEPASPLSLDLDTPEDLVLYESVTATRPVPGGPIRR